MAWVKRLSPQEQEQREEGEPADGEDAEIAALGKEMRGTFVPEALEGVIGMMLAGPAGGGMPMGM